MQKKIILFLLFFLIIEGGIYLIENYKDTKLDNLASIFSEKYETQESEQEFINIFPKALEEKKFVFFAEHIPPSKEREKFITALKNFSLITDVKIFSSKNEDWEFFTFYGISKNSTRLIAQYGYIEKNSFKIVFLPKIFLEKKMNKKKNFEQNFYTNKTPYPIFFTQPLISIPGNTVIQNTSNTIGINKDIELLLPENIQFLESISTGVRIKII